MGEQVSGRQLAKILGCAPSYISKLKSRGVLTERSADNPQGSYDPTAKKFDVELAQAEIEAGRFPEKDHVREMNADKRDTREDGGDGDSSVQPAGSPEPQDPTSGAGAEPSGAGGPSHETRKRSYQDEKAEQAKVETELKRLKLLEQAGELVRSDHVRAAVIKLCSDIRDKLLALPDRLASQLAAEVEPNAVHNILDGEVRKVLDELADESTGIRKAADRISTGQRQ